MRPPMGGGGRGGVQNNTTTFVFNAMQSETLGFFSLNKILIEMNILRKFGKDFEREGNLI